MHRLWGIRHIRYAWHRARLAYYLFLGHGEGFRMPSPEDLFYLELIWKGKA